MAMLVIARGYLLLVLSFPLFFAWPLFLLPGGTEKPSLAASRTAWPVSTPMTHWQRADFPAGMRCQHGDLIWFNRNSWDLDWIFFDLMRFWWDFDGSSMEYNGNIMVIEWWFPWYLMECSSGHSGWYLNHPITSFIGGMVTIHSHGCKHDIVLPTLVGSQKWLQKIHRTGDQLSTRHFLTNSRFDRHFWAFWNWQWFRKQL